MARVTDMGLGGVMQFIPRRFADDRGWFAETYRDSWLEEAGLQIRFVQDNQSLSTQTGTIRGLHFQYGRATQAKLVRCLSGAIWDVAVDLRHGSPTFGRYVGAHLSAENGAQLFVPQGFAHGFITLAPDTMVAYKVDAYYDASREGAVVWDDRALAIDWPLPDGMSSPVLSDKDAHAPRLETLPQFFIFDPDTVPGVSCPETEVLS